MKQYGKVIEYDGYIGSVINGMGTIYKFTNKDLKEDISEGDFVTFTEEIFKTVEVKEYLARFITKTNPK